MTEPLELSDLDLTPWFELTPVPGELPRELFLSDPAAAAPVAPPAPPAVPPLPPPIPSPFQREPGLPEPGTALGVYRLERVIGMGGFGAVYRARHAVLDTVVAIKLMRPSVARRRRTIPQLFREEARVAARVDHPNVVRVFDVAASELGTYIVMEYVDGPDLSVLIRRRGALPPKMVIRVLRHVSAGLAAGLAKGSIHRDVKPSNILLHREGRTKLVDFGLARNASTGIIGVVGTAGYMAPELHDQPDSVDFRADIFSLGVTAFQALTARLPFPDRDPRAASPLDLLALAPATPPPLAELVMRMLARAPAQRPESYAALDAALAAARAVVRP